MYRKSNTNNSVKFYFIPVFREKESKNGDGQKQQLILVTLVLQNWAMPAVNLNLGTLYTVNITEHRKTCTVYENRTCMIYLKKNKWCNKIKEIVTFFILTVY